MNSSNHLHAQRDHREQKSLAVANRSLSTGSQLRAFAAPNRRVSSPTGLSAPIQLGRKGYSSCRPWEDNYQKDSVDAGVAVRSFTTRSDNGIAAGNFAEQVIIETYRSGNVKAEFGIPKGSKNLKVAFPESMVVNAVSNPEHKQTIVADLLQWEVIQRVGDGKYAPAFYWRMNLDKIKYKRSVIDNKASIIELLEGAERFDLSLKYGERNMPNTMGFVDMEEAGGIYEIKANSPAGHAKGAKDVQHYVSSANMAKPRESPIVYHPGSSGRRGDLPLGVGPEGQEYILRWNNGGNRAVVTYDYSLSLRETFRPDNIMMVLTPYYIHLSPPEALGDLKVNDPVVLKGKRYRIKKVTPHELPGFGVPGKKYLTIDFKPYE